MSKNKKKQKGNQKQNHASSQQLIKQRIEKQTPSSWHYQRRRRNT